MSPAPLVSVVVVAHDMEREPPRTLRTLDPSYQREIDLSAYEVILVDNGSGRPVDERLLGGFGGAIRHLRIDPRHPRRPGPPTSASARHGPTSSGSSSTEPGWCPRLVATAPLASRLADRPVITAPAWHLGPTTHMRAAEADTTSAEDAMLRDAGWANNGYVLFGLATLAGSSWRGWFGATSESSSLFLRAETWRALDGLDERFDLPGGGLVNHDLYERACGLPGQPARGDAR